MKKNKTEEIVKEFVEELKKQIEKGNYTEEDVEPFIDENLKDEIRANFTKIFFENETYDIKKLKISKDGIEKYRNPYILNLEILSEIIKKMILKEFNL